MQPGDIEYIIVQVTDTAGAPVTGLVTGDFTVDYYLDATTPSSVFTATELNGGFYRLALTLPGTAGSFTAIISEGTDIVSPSNWHGEIEEQDNDSIFALLVRPQTQLTGDSAIASEVTLTLNSYRYKSLSVTVVDQAGDPIDLSGYNNWKFSVWDSKHTGSVYSLTSGITGSAGGVVTWSIPEDATFFSYINAAIAAGDAQASVFYDMIADEDSDADKTSTIFRGQLVLTRFEGAA